MNVCFAVLMIGLLSFFGCAKHEPKVVHLQNEFIYADVKPLLQQGSNSVRGSALIRQNGGGIVSCAGKEVKLVPATQYSTERMLEIYRNINAGYIPISLSGTPDVQFSPDSMEYYEHTKSTMCDAQGYFLFSNIADGNFFVITNITWIVGNSAQGGSLMKSVSVKGGETMNVVLAP